MNADVDISEYFNSSRLWVWARFHLAEKKFIARNANSLKLSDAPRPTPHQGGAFYDRKNNFN